MKSDVQTDGAAPMVGYLRLPWAVVLIVVVGGLAYANSFAGEFMLDDSRSISDNVAAIHSLWPPQKIFSSPLFVTRPVVGYSLALSYALSGLQVWGYHLINLAIHLAAGLVLWAILIETFPLVKGGAERAGMAVLVALLWTVHPLQTQAVTYIIQRTEALMGLFYLLTILFAARAATRGRLWAWAAVGACALGMGSKQVMVTAPLVVLLYDRAFIAGSFRRALRTRWGLYLGLASTWNILFITLHFAPTTLGAGFSQSTIGPWAYARTQPEVILHYLRLCFWPYPQCLDDMWPVATKVWQVLPAAMFLLVGLVLTAWALARRPVLGFLGACFFLFLSPSSSIVPIEDLAFEHRMYLALAPIIILVVLASQAGLNWLVEKTKGPWLLRTAKYGIAPAIVLACLFTTMARNRDYHDQITMWSKVVKLRPWNFRAHNNLGLGLRAANLQQPAEIEFREAVRLHPNCWYALYNLGISLELRGAHEEAVACYERTLQNNKSYTPAQGKLTNALNNIGLARRQAGRLDESAGLFRRAIGHDAGFWQAHYNLGLVLSQKGNYDPAIAEFRETLRLNPSHLEAGKQAAWAAYHAGQERACAADSAGAMVRYREALSFVPGYADALAALQAPAYCDR
jgi:tetratricopeptide (TPR) repeat protein